MNTLFSHLIGHSDLKALLLQLLEDNTFPSVSLFYGPAGVGKSLFARAVSQRLVQTTKKEAPDIHIFSPEGKSYHHPIESIRDLISELGLPAFESPCKVFIIEEADRMLPTSSNALLKALEEPASDTYFILTSSEPSKLLATIMSRCHKIQFFPIPETEISNYLIQHQQVSPEESCKIAVLSEGSLGKALFIKQHPHKQALDLVLRSSDYPQLMEALSQLDDTLEIADEDEGQRLKQVDVIFEEILFWIRDKHPLMLEKALSKIIEARMALTYNLKVKTILENFFLSLNF